MLATCGHLSRKRHTSAVGFRKESRYRLNKD